MRVWIVSLATFGLAHGLHAQVVLGQKDTFSSGTFENWGGNAPKTNEASGGPAGAGDRFLRVTTTGSPFGSGSHLAMYNNMQWSGGYTAAGVVAIEYDIRNLSTTDTLDIRLVLWGVSARWASAATVLPPNSGWVHVRHELKESSFTPIFAFETFSQTLALMERIMIRHQPVATDSGGTATNAPLGLDNIEAKGAETTVSGNVNFGELSASPAGLGSLTFEFREPGTTTVVSTYVADLSDSGAFTITAPATAGPYDLAVKHRHWLRSIASVNTTSGNVAGVILNPVNGDIDGDNGVTLLDYDVFSDYFDRFSTDSDWTTVGSNGFAPRDADLDEDGGVTLVDYDIFSAHYDEVGPP